ncbi:hypothetical protein ABZX30_22070 [Streptomyces sp. NPDC004542]|uniref:hypothetical protein n=1 Tax=Streptomyces sp. NPDC004542 TaxID=3154281 RepID=UPI0033BF9716
MVNLLAVRHPHAVRSVIGLGPAHGATGAEAQQIPARLAEYERHGARAAAAFVAGAFSPQAPPGLRTAHIRTWTSRAGRRAGGRRRSRARAVPNACRRVLGAPTDGAGGA